MHTRIAKTLQPHPTLRYPDGSPVFPLGVSRRSGNLIWPVRGGSGDDEDADDGDPDDQTDDAADKDADDGDKADEADEELGPKGTKALEAEKTKRRAAQSQLREWKALGLTPADVKKRLDALPAAGKDDKAPDPDAIRAEIKAEVDVERQRERVLDKIEAKAAKGFADPDDAAALLLRGADVNDFLDENGKIDVEAIEDGLKALLEKKPYLAAQGGKRFKGGGDGGARKEQKAKPTSLQDAVAARIAAGSTSR
jgi:hypothetical protein